MNIGFFLKRIRTERDYTLKDVAAGVNLTSSLVSQIESGKSSPSLNSLDALLRYYKVSLSDFFKQVEQKDYILVTKVQIETIKNNVSGVNLSLLASKLENNAIESYFVEMLPTAKIDVVITVSKKRGERLLYMLNGSAEITLADEKLQMNAGDSLNFKSYLPCSVFNFSPSEVCSFLITGSPNIF